MALIEKAKGRRGNQSPSGYTRLFGIPQLGQLISRVHSAGITAGTELEKLIWERVQQIDNLDQFVEETMHAKKEGIWVAQKKQIKVSKKIQSKFEPDFLAFDLNNRICYVIEVKDGDQFDTKKSQAEHDALNGFRNDVAARLPFSAQIYISSFNSEDKSNIVSGLKGSFSKDEVMTGKELCKLLKIDFEEIIRVRNLDAEKNVSYFVRGLLEIDKIKKIIVKLIRG
jgi:hypothetical protein